MVIKPSTCLRNEYNDIAEFCKTENQTVFRISIHAPSRERRYCSDS